RMRAAVERAAALLDQVADLRQTQLAAVVALDQVHAELVLARDPGGGERIVALVKRTARREAGRGLALQKILKRNRGVGPPHHILGHTLLRCSSPLGSGNPLLLARARPCLAVAARASGAHTRPNVDNVR